MQSFGVLIRKPFVLFQKLGWWLGISTGFRYLFKTRKMYFHYPHSSRQYEVQFNLAWKYIERGVASESWCYSYFRENVVESGDIIIDVGANIGRHTLLFSELVGDQGKVIAFEPDPVNLKTLRTNLKQNEISNVVVEPLCVSDAKGTVVLSGSPLGSPRSSIIRYQKNLRNVQSLQVGSVSLDDFCEEAGIAPNGIKIDAEGAEWLIIKGMKQIVSRYKPWVFVEIHGRILDELSLNAMLDFFRKEAKKIIFMEDPDTGHKAGDPVEWSEVPSKAHLLLAWF